MSQIVKKFIGANQVDDTILRLRNNQSLRARNAADSADVNILKVNASNVPEFQVQAQSPFTPSAANDIANKDYVDTAVAAVSSPDYKSSVRVATTGSNITLSGTQTIDGVSVIAGNRVLVKDQTTASENGIYVCAAGAWSRSTDADASAEVTSMMLVPVSEGTLNGNTFWYISTADPITLGSTSIAFAKLGRVSAKESLTLNGTDITNQYKDLAKLIEPSSLMLSVDGVIQYEGSDYTLSTVGGVTRITFAGDLATGGNAALVSGDILRCQYRW